MVVVWEVGSSLMVVVCEEVSSLAVVGKMCSSSRVVCKVGSGMVVV
jgi:hypothetical protein